MADVSINFSYLNGDVSTLSFPCDFTFHDLKWYNDSYASLFHAGDYVFIDKYDLLSNYSEQTIHVIKRPFLLLEQNLDEIDWFELSSNKNAISILEQNLDKINWRELSSNVNAISILEQHIDLIDWSVLSSNVNAISILEQNVTKIDWGALSRNPSAQHILEEFGY